MKYTAIPAFNGLGIQQLQLVVDICRDPEKIGKVLDEIKAAREEANEAIAEANLADDVTTALAAAKETQRNAENLSTETRQKCDAMLGEAKIEIAEERTTFEKEREASEETLDARARALNVKENEASELSTQCRKLKEELEEKIKHQEAATEAANATKKKYENLIAGIDQVRENA